MRALPHILAVLAASALTAGASNTANAAGAAFAVDTAEISEIGSCKVESWFSWASNRDLVGTVNPACVFDLGRAVEMSAQIVRSRADGEFSNTIAPKAKTNVIPTAIGRLGVAVAGGATLDIATGEVANVFAYAPATLRLSETARININVGWLLDRTSDRNFLTYGLGTDLKLTDTVIYTAEVFGQAGHADDPAVTRARFQSGLRWRPVDRFSVDLIYGHNINGENAHWITLGSTIRFPAK